MAMVPRSWPAKTWPLFAARSSIGSTLPSSRLTKKLATLQGARWVDAAGVRKNASMPDMKASITST